MTIGIDIGGTNIKGVLLDGKKVAGRIKISTQSKTNKKLLIGQIFKCIEKLIAMGKTVKGIGIGVAGPVDFENQKILNPPNVTALENLYLGRIIEKKIKINKNGRKCNCGRRECLEAYINEKGIQKTAKEIFGREIGTIKLYEMTKKKNKKAIKVWEIIGKYLGLGLANIVDTLNPDIIVIGGGIANAGEFLLNPAKKE